MTVDTLTDPWKCSMTALYRIYFALVSNNSWSRYSREYVRGVFVYRSRSVLVEEAITGCCPFSRSPLLGIPHSCIYHISVVHTSWVLFISVPLDLGLDYFMQIRYVVGLVLRDCYIRINDPVHGQWFWAGSLKFIRLIKIHWMVVHGGVVQQSRSLGKISSWNLESPNRRFHSAVGCDSNLK